MVSKLETNISQINSSLYVGQMTLQNGQDCYFGFEEIDAENKGFWQIYEKKTARMTPYISQFCRALVKPTNKKFEIDYSDEETEKIKQFVLKKGWFKKADPDLCPLQGVLGGTAGMNGKALPSDPRTMRFMIYASKRPVKEKHADESAYALACEIDSIKKYREKFGHIIMSAVFIADVDTPTIHN